MDKENKPIGGNRDGRNSRSFRRSTLDGLVKEGQTRSQIFFRFLDENGDEREVLLSFRSKEKKSLRLMASVLEAWVNTWEISPQLP